MQINIPHRNGSTLYTTDVADDDTRPTRTAVERALREGMFLMGAYLTRADLTGANLTCAYLRGAYLTRAALTGANLTYANLTGANLTGADLTGADLTGANLRGANLTYANLVGAYLTVIREDVREILSAAPNEVTGLLEALQAGRVDGSAYEGECACLIGTIANVRGCSYQKIGIAPDSSRPAERWFLGISKGHTPENNPIAKITEEWIVEWMTGQDLTA